MWSAQKSLRRSFLNPLRDVIVEGGKLVGTPQVKLPAEVPTQSLGVTFWLAFSSVFLHLANPLVRLVDMLWRPGLFHLSTSASNRYTVSRLRKLREE